MTEEEIKEYINRKDELLLKLSDKDKDTLEWILFGYNECARLLDEKIKENQKLKSQYCERTDCSGRIGNSKKVEQLQQENQELKKQQKEFIEWLENLINNANKVLDNPKEDEEIKSYVLSRKFVLEHVLSQYKEIIGVDK